MNLEKQLVNFELSRKLDELGVKLESLFVRLKWSVSHPKFVLWSREEYENYSSGYFLNGGDKTEGDKFALYSAYTVAEMGEIVDRKIAEYEEELD